jgi:ribosomal protein S18 acetylase RimI-like enzyme
VIKEAEKTDIKNISNLILNAIDDIANMLTGEDSKDKILKTLDNYIVMDVCRLSHKNIYTYIKDEKIVAILVAYSSNDIDILDKPMLEHLAKKGIKKECFDKECFADEFYIDTISVLEDYQGLGIAKELFAFAFNIAKQKGFSKTSLLVDINKEKAKNLYLKMGFKDNKILEVNKTDFYHMIKEI